MQIQQQNRVIPADQIYTEQYRRSARRSGIMSEAVTVKKLRQSAHQGARGFRCSVRSGDCEALAQGAPRLDKKRRTRIPCPGTGQRLPEPTTDDGTGALMRRAERPKGTKNRPIRPRKRSLADLLEPPRPAMSAAGSLASVIQHSLNLN